MYLAGVCASFMLGGVLALMIRAHLFYGDGFLFSNKVYNQIFTLHGAVMVFLFIILAFLRHWGTSGSGDAGCEGCGLSQLNLGSFYLWVTGAVLFLVAMFATGLDTGWTFYTPYSIDTSDSVILRRWPSSCSALARSSPD